ncbi:MAG: hypothetical protein WBA46_06070 [Thermomicrobiales bacterium]
MSLVVSHRVLAQSVSARVRVWGVPFAVAAAVGLRGVHVAAQGATPDASPAITAGEADLSALKAYVVEHVDALVQGATDLQALAGTYYDLAKGAEFDYQALWDVHGDTLATEFARARELFTTSAHGSYEMVEGLVAGLPSLVEYDVWLDAGPTGAEDPTNARQWTLTLPDGSSLENPGNIFHTLLEPVLWNTDTKQFGGLRIDTDGDGNVAIPDGLPDANLLAGLTRALVDASGQLRTAVDAWQPTLADAFTALVVMLPTADGYFADWAASPFVLGDASTQTDFVANSRLLDVLGIYGGLQLTWRMVGGEVAAVNAGLANQIQIEMDSLVGFAQNLYDHEQAGTSYTPEQADQFGTEVQSQAESLAGQITQAAALLGLQLDAGA